jgi:hypothetical protein
MRIRNLWTRDIYLDVVEQSSPPEIPVEAEARFVARAAADGIGPLDYYNLQWLFSKLNLTPGVCQGFNVTSKLATGGENVRRHHSR